jgi:hypothetical protein
MTIEQGRDWDCGVTVDGKPWINVKSGFELDDAAEAKRWLEDVRGTWTDYGLNLTAH